MKIFNEIRTFTGTIGFSVSVDGTGGQTLFSNLTTDPGRSESEAREGETAEAPEASLGLEGSHILTRLEIDPVLFLLFSSSMMVSSTSSSSSLLQGSKDSARALL